MEKQEKEEEGGGGGGGGDDDKKADGNRGKFDMEDTGEVHHATLLGSSSIADRERSETPTDDQPGEYQNSIRGRSRTKKKRATRKKRRKKTKLKSNEGEYGQHDNNPVHNVGFEASAGSFLSHIDGIIDEQF